MPRRFDRVLPSSTPKSRPTQAGQQNRRDAGARGASHASPSIQGAVGHLGSRLVAQSLDALPWMQTMPEEVKSQHAGEEEKKSHHSDGDIESTGRVFSEGKTPSSIQTGREAASLRDAKSSMKNVLHSITQGGINTLFHLSNFLRQVRPLIALTGTISSKEASAAASAASLLLLYVVAQCNNRMSSGRLGKSLKNIQLACSVILDPLKRTGDLAAYSLIESTLKHLGCRRSPQKNVYKIVSIGLAILNSRTTDRYLNQLLTSPVQLRRQGSSFGFTPTSHNANAIANRASIIGPEDANFLDVLRNIGPAAIGFMMPNQLDGIQAQLDSGIRALMLDVKVGDHGELLSTHNILPYGDFISVLKPIKEFLNDPDNNEPILLFIENQNDVSLTQFRDIFSEAGLNESLPTSEEQWLNQLQGKNDTSTSKSKLYPIITRTWNTGSSTSGYDFLQGQSIIGDTPEALAEARNSTYRPYGNYTMPSSNYTMPGSNYTMPNLNSTMPGSNYTMPNLNSTIPDGNYTIPNLNSTIPDGNYTIPNLNNTIPDSNHSAPKIMPLVLILESDYSSLSIDRNACPLSCKEVDHGFCIQLLNHFGPVPLPRLFNFLDEPGELLQAHMDNCEEDTNNRTTYAAMDHTSFYKYR